MPEPRYGNYMWVGDEQCLFEAFGLTIVTDATIDDVLSTLPPLLSSDRGGYAEIEDRAFDEPSDWIAGLLEVNNSVVIYERSPDLTVYPLQLRSALSTERIVVCCGVSGNGKPFFELFRNDDLVSFFDPIRAKVRDGTDPNAPLDSMRRVGGFDLDRTDDNAFPDFTKRMAATFALTEAVTGVEITSTMLNDSDYMICQFDDHTDG